MREPLLIAAAQNGRGERIAREHDVWVVFASFAGPTGGGYQRTAGSSAIWAPGGQLESQTGPEPGAVAKSAIEPGRLRES